MAHLELHAGFRDRAVCYFHRLGSHTNRCGDSKLTRCSQQRNGFGDYGLNGLDVPNYHPKYCGLRDDFGFDDLNLCRPS